MRIEVKNAQAAFEFLEQLTKDELKAGKEFTWRFSPAVYDYYDSDNNKPAMVEFEFLDPKLETYYRLKWL